MRLPLGVVVLLVLVFGGCGSDSTTTVIAPAETDSTTTTTTSGTSDESVPGVTEGSSQREIIYSVFRDEASTGQGALTPEEIDCVISKFDDVPLSEIMANPKTLGVQFTTECIQ